MPEKDGFTLLSELKFKKFQLIITTAYENYALQAFKENAIDYSIHYVSAAEIDMHNILQATLNGMHKALDKLLVAPDYLLVDGSCFNPYEKNEKITVLK